MEDRLFKSPENAKKASSQPLSSSAHPQHVNHTTTIGSFEEGANVLNLPRAIRTKEISAEDWMSFFDNEGRIMNESEVRARIFRGVRYIKTFHYILTIYLRELTLQFE